MKHYHSYLHFQQMKPKALKKLNNLLKVTQLAKSRAEWKPSNLAIDCALWPTTLCLYN